MAVTFHNATLTSGPISAGPRVLLHTATAGSVLLVWTRINEAASISAIAAAGVQLSRLGFIDAGSGRMEVWGLTAPGSGVLTISAALVGANVATYCLIATSYVGQKTDVGGPFGTVVAQSINGKTVNLSVSSTTTDIVTFGFGVSANLAITLNNGNLRGTATLSTNGRLMVGDIAGATAVSVSASAATTGDLTTWGMLGLPIVASAGLATRTGSMSATDAADTFAAPTKIIISSRLSATDAADVFASTAKNRITGFMSATDVGADTFASTAKTRVSGRLSATDAADTFAAVGGQTIVSGRLSATDAQDTFAAASYVVVSGRLSATDAPDIFLAQSTPPNRSATFAATDQPDTFAASANIRISSHLSATDAPDTFAATAFNRVTGLLSATDSPDIFLATSSLPNRSATFAATDAPDVFAATGTVLAVSAPAAPAIIVTDSSAGHGDKRNNKKPPYIRAPDDFWKARERYLLSLQPEIDAEPEVIIEEIFPDSNVTAEPASFDPLLLISYRQERSELIASIPTATTMRSLRSYGERLRLINDHILRQKRLELIAAHSELAAIQEKLRVRRKLRNLRISRLRKIHATLEIAQSLTHFYAHH